MCLERKVEKADSLVPEVPGVKFLKETILKDKLQSCFLESEENINGEEKILQKNQCIIKLKIKNNNSGSTNVT